MKNTILQMIIDTLLLACAGATIYLIYILWNTFPGANATSLIIYPVITLLMVGLVLWPMYKFRQVLFHYNKFNENKIAKAKLEVESKTNQTHSLNKVEASVDTLTKAKALLDSKLITKAEFDKIKENELNI